MTSEETKKELRAAHQRVMSVAAVQGHLHASDGIEQIEMGPYLTKLGSGLASSMVSPEQHIGIKVLADPGTLATSHAVSLGLVEEHIGHCVVGAASEPDPAARADAIDAKVKEAADAIGRLLR